MTLDAAYWPRPVPRHLDEACPPGPRAHYRCSDSRVPPPGFPQNG